MDQREVVDQQAPVVLVLREQVPPQGVRVQPVPLVQVERVPRVLQGRDSQVLQALLQTSARDQRAP